MATLKITLPNGTVFEGNTIEEIQSLINLHNSIIGTATPSSVESGKGSATATAKKELEITAEQKAIVDSFKPTHRLGTDKGSIHNCLRECAYSFCGGKDKYKKDLYTLGKMAWFKAYDKTFRETLPDTI